MSNSGLYQSCQIIRQLRVLTLVLRLTDLRARAMQQYSNLKSLIQILKMIYFETFEETIDYQKLAMT